MLGDLQDRLHETERAEEAEHRLHGAHDDSQKVLDLAKEVKEKHLLIGKLRHEGKQSSADMVTSATNT